MEGFIDSQHGVSVLLASVVVMLALHLVAKIGEFLFDLLKKKEHGSERQVAGIELSLTQNTQAVRELRMQVQLLERELIEVHKFKADSQKLFSAIKIIAGAKWPRVRKAMEEDALPK